MRSLIGLHSIAAFAFVVAAAGVGAQQAIGEVRTLEDEAWVGAKVTLIGNRSWVAVDERLVKKLTAVTDHRGRFRIPVPGGLRYSVFVTAPKTGPVDSGWRMTDVHEGLVAGAPVLLREIEHRGAIRRLRLHGIRAWTGFGPLSLRVVPQIQNRTARTVPVPEKGDVTLPPQIAKVERLEVVAGNGMVIWAEHCGRSAWLPEKVRRSEFRPIDVKPPRTVRAAIRDSASGRGVKAATIFAASIGLKVIPDGHIPVHVGLVPIGKTDASGVAELVVAAVPINLFVRGQGLALTRLRKGEARAVKDKTWKPLAGDKSIDFHANVRPGRSFRGRVLLAPGRPARRAAVQLTGVIYDVVYTDDEGRFAIEGCSDDPAPGFRCDLLLGPQHIAELPAAWRDHLQFQVDSFVTLPRGARNGTGDLGDIDLSAFCPVRLGVVTPRDQPADGARIWVASGAAVSHRTNHRGHATDRAGQAILLLASGRTHTLVVEHTSGTAIRRVAVTGSVIDERVVPLRVQTEATLTISGTVKTAKDKVVSSFRVFRSSRPGLRRNVGLAVSGRSEPSEQTHARNQLDLEAVPPEDVLTLYNTHNLFPNSTLTDESGRFSMRVPNVPARYRLFGSRKVLGMFRQQVSGSAEIEGKSVAVELIVR